MVFVLLNFNARVCFSFLFYVLRGKSNRLSAALTHPQSFIEMKFVAFPSPEIIPRATDRKQSAKRQSHDPGFYKGSGRWSVFVVVRELHVSTAARETAPR